MWIDRTEGPVIPRGLPGLLSFRHSSAFTGFQADPEGGVPEDDSVVEVEAAG